ICVLSHRETYDIRSGSVRQGWEHFLLSIRERQRKQMTKCTACRIRSVCSMCPANGELENGDPESPVDFLCEVAHLRAMALRFEVPQHGECEFCSHRERAQVLRAAAKRIAAREINAAAWTTPQSLLPVLNQSVAVGCNGCGVH